MVTQSVGSGPMNTVCAPSVVPWSHNKSKKGASGGSHFPVQQTNQKEQKKHCLSPESGTVARVWWGQPKGGPGGPMGATQGESRLRESSR